MSRGADAFFARVHEAIADEYAIEGELGRGGMATVFVATDLQLRRKVAIKVMSPEMDGVAGVQNRFVIEARTAAYLDHPNIITVYSVKEVDDLLLIVMKFVDGRTIGELNDDRGPAEVDVAASIVTKVADALHYAHGEGIVHRDIKPSNIMIDRRGRPIVTDFGIAKIAPGAPTRIASVEAGTIPGTLLGTAAYMSPEQCRGLTATPASDQYSLGVTAYELLSGRPPFEGPILSLIDAHKSRSPRPLRERAPHVDPDVEETVMRMLAKDPDQRWPSLQDVTRRMTSHAASAGARPASPEMKRRIAELATPGRSARGGPADRPKSTPSPNLAVRPGEPSIEVGEEVRLVLSDPGDGSLGGAPVEWRSEDVEVAAVDESGVVTGRTPGVAKVTAKTDEGVGRATVTVTPATVETITVTPRRRRLEVGEAVRFSAEPLDVRGNVVAGKEIVWTSSDPSVCTVSDDGRALGRAAGAARLVAACEDARTVAEVQVRAEERRTRVAPAAPGGGSEAASPEETVVAEDAEGAGTGGPAASEPEATAVPEPADTRIEPADTRIPDPATARAPAARKTASPRGEGEPSAVGTDRAERTTGLPVRGVLTAGLAVLVLGVGAWAGARWLGDGGGSDGVASADGAPGVAAPEAVDRGGEDPGGSEVDLAGGAGSGSAAGPPGRPDGDEGRPGDESAGAPQGGEPSEPGPTGVDEGRPSASETALVATREEPAPEREGAAPERGEPAPDAEPPIDFRDDAGAEPSDAGAAGPDDGSGVADPEPAPDTAAGAPGGDDPPPPARDGRPSSPDDSAVVVAGDAAETDAGPSPPSEDEATDDGGDAAAAAGAEATEAPGEPADRFCDDPAVPRRALAAALTPDPAERLEGLYAPVDAEDEEEKEALLDALSGAGSPRATSRTLRSEPGEAGCDWVLQVDFEWTNAFGQPRGRSVEIRVELADDSGVPRVSRISGASAP